MKLTYNKSCLGSKLFDELVAAGISLEVGIAPVQTGDGVTYIYVPDESQKAQIDAIVANHDPTPPPYQPTVEEQLMLALTDAQLKLADQQQLINQLALAITDLQLQGGTV